MASQTTAIHSGASSNKRRKLGYVWGVAAPLVCTLIDWPLQQWLGPASILMTYLLGVFLVASRYGRGPAVLASLLSAPVFAFYYGNPIFSFAIHDLDNIIGLVVMILVANITASLLEKSRTQAELARRRESRANALYRLSRDLSTARDRNSVGRIVMEHVHDEFGLPSVLLTVDSDHCLNTPSASPLPYSLNQIDMAEAQRVFENRKISYQDEVSYFPLKGSNDWQGLLLVYAGKSSSPSFQDTGEQSAFFDTYCHLIGQSLERLQLVTQAQEAALQAEKEAWRNALLSSISHDLRTPLTRIIGAASELIEGESQLSLLERQDIKRVVLEEAQRMSELTDKLLDMARLNTGEITLHRDWNALEEIVGSALNRLDKHLMGRPVRTLLPDGLPLLWVDAVLIEQVLVNLIENAIKYSPEGSPIDICGSLLDGDYRIAVVDYGPGIAKGQEKQIFEKFYRGVAETDQSGVGLGLALCKAIVESHGGAIQAMNRIGKGAEFVVTLPLHDPPPVARLENIESTL